MSSAFIKALAGGQRRVRVFCLLAGIASAGTAAAVTWHVPGDMPTVGAALEAAVAGDTVTVAAGRYEEHGLVARAGVVLRGPDLDADSVVLDGLGQGRILDIGPGPAPAVVIGVTFTGGSAPPGFLEALGGGVRCREAAVRLEHCRFVGNRARLGAGFGAEASDVTVRDCSFTANTATDSIWAAGGGVWCRGSTGSFRRIEIRGNTAYSDNPDNPGDAGGMYLSGCAIEVADAVFADNATAAGAGHLYSVNGDSSSIRRCTFTGGRADWGGAVHLEASHAHLDSCGFSGNAARSGGAVYLVKHSTAVLSACSLVGNHADLAGGAVTDWDSGPTFRECRFEANDAGSSGGAVRLGGDYARIEDCVFYANTAGARGGAVYGDRTSSSMTGCTFAANAAPDGGGLCFVASFPVVDRSVIAFAPVGAAVTGTYAESMTVTCCDVFGNAGGDWVGPLAGRDIQDGNLAVDPGFCELAAGALGLAADSPLRDAGACGRIGALDTACGAAAVPAPAVRPILTLLPAYPNPFNPSVTLPFALSVAGPTEVAVFDLAGRRVKVLIAEHLDVGRHEAVWDGRDACDRLMAAGVYVVRVRTGRSSARESVLLLK